MPEIVVTGGTIRGTVENGVARFLGIPFAAPPVGELRMEPPAAVVGWTGVREATAYGPTPPKGPYAPSIRHLFPEPVVDGEECLNLNVWTPEDALPGGSLPVLVWLHGGGFTNGSGAVPAYDGTGFARDGVLCVTLNYRLGADGFLFTEADHGAPRANLGLQDQIAALRWVWDNIARFGGDPSRVTVAGQSAGAMSATDLMAVPTAEGLFAQVIAQSAPAAEALPGDVGVEIARLLAERLGVDPTREAIAAADPDAVVEAVQQLVGEVDGEPDRWGELAMRVLPFSPVIDGALLPVHPLDAIAQGSSRGVRVLVGSLRQESRLFTVPDGVIDLVDDDALAAAATQRGLSAAGLALYRRNHPAATPGDLLSQVLTDWHFARPAIQLAEARERGGATTTWAYRFDRPLPEQNGRLGAAHAAELPYVFDTIHDPELTALVGPEPSRQVARTAHATWVRFIATGDPGWDPYTTRHRTTALLTETVTVIDDPDGDERAAWDDTTAPTDPASR